LKQFV